MDFRILGPLEVEDDGRSLTPSGGKPRALLALLVLHANEPVAADRLVDELWGDEPPANAAKTLQIHVSRLRRSLGTEGVDGRLATVPSGYLLRVGESELDRDHAEALLDRGRTELAAGDAEAAARTLRDGLRLFRGEPLADVAYESFAQAEIGRLQELRLQLVEERIAADLARGRHDEVVAELERLVAEQPLRERPRAQLMLALYRSGRQADALAAYRDYRARLDEELGLAPGPDLRGLERGILEHDPALAPARGRARAGPPSRSRRTGARRLGAAAVAAGLALLAAAAVLRSGQDAGVPPRSLAVVDAAGTRLVAAVRLAGSPTDVVVGRRAVFVAVPRSRTVVAVTPGSHAHAALGTPVATTRLAAGHGVVWAIDGRTNTVAQLGSTRVHALAPGSTPRELAPIDAAVVHRGELWVADRGATSLSRLDASSGRVAHVANRGRDSFFERDGRRGLAAVAGSIWTSNPVTVHPQSERLGRVSRIDAASGRVVTRIRVPAPPLAIAADERAVWVALERGEQLWRIDPRDELASAAVTVPGGVVDVALAGDAVWALGPAGMLTRIDARRNEITARVELGRPGVALAAGHGAVWVAIP